VTGLATVNVGQAHTARMACPQKEFVSLRLAHDSFPLFSRPVMGNSKRRVVRFLGTGQPKLISTARALGAACAD
jgi:hypothetical protein